MGPTARRHPAGLRPNITLEVVFSATSSTAGNGVWIAEATTPQDGDWRVCDLAPRGHTYPATPASLTLLLTPSPSPPTSPPV